MARILSQVVGQKKALRQIEAAISMGRFPMTSLFSGPSGVGKKLSALGVAQALVCENDKLACGQCGSCLRIANKQSENLLIIEPSGTQLKVDEAREAIRFVSLQKVGQARVVIIDGAEKLNPAASNSLLKTLEEPPEGSYFILIASSLATILPTIRSRSQLFRFSPLTNEEIGKIGQFDDWAVQACGGSVEKAEILSGSGDLQELRHQAFDLLQKSFSSSTVFGEVKDLVKDKSSSLFLAQSLQSWVRDLYHLRGDSKDKLYNQDQVSWSEPLAMNMNERALDQLWASAVQFERDILGNVDRQLSLENFLLNCRRN